MPKSSSASFVPEALRSPRTMRARSASWRKTDSVISIVSHSGAWRCCQGLGHGCGEVGCHQLVCGYVHGDGEVFAADFGGELVAVDAGLLEDPLTDVDDQVRLFGDRDEGGGCDGAVCGMVPAQECFGGVYASVGCADDWLVFDPQLVPGEGLFEVALEAAAVSAIRSSRRSMTWWLAPPLRLTWYIAVSASCRSWSEMFSPWPAKAIPTLAVMAISVSVRANGAANASIVR